MSLPMSSSYGSDGSAQTSNGVIISLSVQICRSLFLTFSAYRLRSCKSYPVIGKETQIFMGTFYALKENLVIKVSELLAELFGAFSCLEAKPRTERRSRIRRRVIRTRRHEPRNTLVIFEPRKPVVFDTWLFLLWEKFCNLLKVFDVVRFNLFRRFDNPCHSMWTFWNIRTLLSHCAVQLAYTSWIAYLDINVYAFIRE